MRTLIFAFVALTLALIALPASAVVTENVATSESAPTGSYSGFDWSGLYQAGAKTLTAVDSYWLLSSRHAPLSVGGTFSGDGTTYTVQEVVNNPSGADLSLIRVDQALPVFYELYAGTVTTNGANQTEVLMLGTGHTGTTTDNVVGLDEFTWDAGTSRQRRWGTNQIDAIESLSNDYGTHDTMRADFVLGDTTYEAGIADHDSGGGWFVDDSGTWKLLGVTWANGGIAPNPPFESSYAVDVRSYSTWVNNTVPEPATMSLLGMGGLALLLRRRRRKA